MKYEIYPDIPSRYTKNFGWTKSMICGQISEVDLQQQSCAKLKEIKQIIGESAWEYNQCLHYLINSISYSIHEM